MGDEDLEKQLRIQKIDTIKGLYSQLYLLEKDEVKRNQFKDVSIDDGKHVAYYDAMIQILNDQLTNAKISEPKIISFNQLEQERENMTKAEKKAFKKQLKRQDKLADSILATIEPRCSLKGNLIYDNSIILRYRGNKAGDQFSKDYPYGVLM